ncbi:MAG: DUF1844 domain-containing protein [Deltaproteobacteria bacterium]|nr:DUF1844 domain-containing protein [Deltaproteobacteria bacterium]MCL4873586.1 DUF1844 domain-containing protein [bacterium]
MERNEKDEENRKEGQEGGGKKAGALPALDFSAFILSLSTSALMNLGLVENPVTKKTEKEPEVAKQTIELIALLKEKTNGNLTEEEAKLVDEVLHELRLWYVKLAS